MVVWGSCQLVLCANVLNCEFEIHDKNSKYYYSCVTSTSRLCVIKIFLGNSH